jgi:hypothetical protein
MKKHNLIGTALYGALVLCVAFSGCGKKANPLNPGTGPAEAGAGLPHVTSVRSSDGDSLLSNSDQIVVVFDKPMDPVTINTSTITVAAYGRESGTKTGTITYYRESNRTVFTPSANFVDSSAYVVTVTTGAHDLKGNPLDGNGNNFAEAAAYDNFRGALYSSGGADRIPDLTPPRVNDWQPQGYMVDSTAQIFLRFNSNDLNGATLNTSTITLWVEGGSQVGLPGQRVVQDSLGSTWVFFDGVSLSQGTVYRVKASVDIKDNGGNSLDGNGNGRQEVALYDEVSWQFCTLITGGNTAPPFKSSHSISALLLTVNFSGGPMDAGTFTADNIKLCTNADKAGYVPGTIRSTFDGNGFTYSLENAPLSGNLYIWISRNVQNSIGANGGRKFKLDSNRNSIGGEEGIPAYKFGGPLASDDFFGQVR